MRIEIRSDSVILDGYVNVTQRLSRELRSPRGKFVEEIMPRTFERALMKTSNVDLLFNHDTNRKLGSIAEGNLDLREDNIGLRATAEVHDAEIIEKAKKGELRGWSFGMHVLRDAWETRSDGIHKRTVEEIDVSEVSILDRQPAYYAPSIEARSDGESILNETRIEEFEAKIEDKVEKTEEPKKVEKREESKAPEPFYYTNLENELTLLSLQGASNK